VFRQARVDKISEKGIREKEFEPITQRLDKVEKAVRQSDEDLIKKYELRHINKIFESLTSSYPVKPLTFEPEDEEHDSINEEGSENIKTIIDKI